MPAAAKPRGRLTERELLSAFRDGYQRRRPGIAYQLGILLVAVTMIVLPMFYLAFIALIIYAVVYHAQNHTALLHMSGSGRAAAMALVIYLAPLVAGPIAVFFMFKPLLARPGGQNRSRSLTRQSEPLLFAFVDRICDVVGAPQPKRIDVDCNVNASAGFRRGLWSMFGSDLVLTIGLPLAAGLTVREFGGVLAHEFGHFTQGLGMRLSYLIRSIVHWFVRVVYQRDQWDEWLEAAAAELDFRIGWVLLVAKLFVWVGRGILWVLFHIGLAISGLLLRQMEYDADRCETLFAGSEAFASTARKLRLLNDAFQYSNVQLVASLDRKQLVSDLPGLVAHHVRYVAPGAWQKVDDEIAESRTGWFDDHPCDRDRIAAAAKLASSGIFHLDRPAGDLFANFNAQTEAATWDLYCAIFGPKVPRSALIPIQQFVATSKV
jgi:Zn-dependent protease with chaperone function